LPLTSSLRLQISFKVRDRVLRFNNYRVLVL
jgi:hypothetical protein